MNTAYARMAHILQNKHWSVRLFFCILLLLAIYVCSPGNPAKAFARYSRPLCYDEKGLSYSEGAIVGTGANRKQCLPTKVDWIQPPQQ